MLHLNFSKCQRTASLNRLSRFFAIAFCIAAPGLGADSVSKPPPQPAVILLTGFEPFGPERRPNSSWEGIRRLDGVVWREYRLVCREMKVLWGQPLRQLRAWNDELQPVAIFSFGQGRNDGYRIETVAHNRRGNGRDNDGSLPPDADIVTGGSGLIQASCPAKRLVASLATRGHGVATSTDAGRYLCEECLYSLEWLRNNETRPMDVIFCHVPPLGKNQSGQLVTEVKVEAFVQDLLDSWLADRKPDAIDDPMSDGRDGEVRALISNYFECWSKQDIDGYGDCFDKGASVQLLHGPGSAVETMTLPRFLDSQRQAHRKASEPMVETAESVDVTWNDRLAHVVVRWKLRKGKMSEQQGYDHFTLHHTDGRWKIVHLLFYAIH